MKGEFQMKKIMILSLVIVLLLSFAACTRQGQPVDPDPQEPGDNVVVDPNPPGETVEVTIYYMNYDYIVTGDESLEKAIPVTREVVVGEKSVEEIIVQELQIEPEEEELTSALTGLKVLSVETAANTAYVNFSSERLSGGSLEETSVLTQLVLSLTELPEIDEVQIYVDGSVRETLMSHYEIMEPITREDLGY